jgi:hypothetical protein
MYDWQKLKLVKSSVTHLPRCNNRKVERHKPHSPESFHGEIVPKHVTIAPKHKQAVLEGRKHKNSLLQSVNRSMERYWTVFQWQYGSVLAYERLFWHKWAFPSKKKTTSMLLSFRKCFHSQILSFWYTTEEEPSEVDQRFYFPFNKTERQPNDFHTREKVREIERDMGGTGKKRGQSR